MKCFYILFFTLIGYTFFLNTTNAQDACGFDKLFQQQLNENIHFRQAVEQGDKQWIAHNRVMRESGRVFSVSGIDEVYEIPVVIHILHTGGAVGSNYNPTDQTMTDWIKYLNDVYAAEHPSYPKAGNGGVKMPVKFVLAKRDPNCQPTNGINRIDMSSYAEYVSHGVKYDETNGMSISDISQLARWPKEAYYNIFVINKIDGLDGYTGAKWAGFAYYGTMSPVYKDDGTYILARYSSKQYSTLPHEIGHAFGLRHTWDGGDATTCAPNDLCDQQGDLVCDTDPSYNLNGKCPAASQVNPCTGQPFGINGVQQNFMNYSICVRNHFTPGQAERMMFMLKNFRAGLIHSLGNVPPVALENQSPLNAQCIPPGILNSQNNALIGPADIILDSIQYYSTGYATNHDNRYYIDNTNNCLFKTHTTLVAERPYDFSVSTTTNMHKVRAYIDYNNDGVFDEGEIVMDDKSNKSNAVFNTIITPPASAVRNTPLRMRVIGDLNSQSINLTPCGQLSYGQTEDFSVTIVEADVLFTGLTSFSARATTKNSVILKWHIENVPVNTLQFELERSSDGKRFVSVAVVPHQHDGKDYYFEDEGISAGRNYFYRLKIVNAGHFEYSHVEMVNLNVENTQQIQVFPNPFRDQLIIRTGGAIRHIKIFDMHGREIMQRSNAVTGSHEMKFALKSYPSGMYLIQITDRNGNVGWKKVIKE